VVTFDDKDDDTEVAGVRKIIVGGRSESLRSKAKEDASQPSVVMMIQKWPDSGSQNICKSKIQ
jgi:hypothetical protein